MPDSRVDFGPVSYSQGRINFRGAWSSLANYAPNDCVSDSGSSYIAIANSINIATSNTLYWSIMCSAGGVSSVSGHVGTVILVSSDLSDHDAALGAPLLDASGFLKPAQFNEGVDAVVATTYAMVAADRGRIKTFSNASPVAISIAQATGSFGTGYFVTLQNINSGLCTVTATTSTIEGSSTVTLKQWESVTLVSAGGNYICLRSKVRLLAADVPSLPASQITSGQIALAQGGTGVDLSAGGGTTMVLAQNASHVISARNLVAADIPSLPASQITSGALALARGGTNADLSATGGTSKVLKQTSVGGAITVAQLASSDLNGGLTLTKTLFTANGTFTIPSNVTAVKVTVVGGGGAGGGSTTSTSGGGGGGGGTAIKWLTGLTPGNTLAVVVGGGGASNSNAAGGNGVNSTVASGTQTITTITGGGGGGGTTATNGSGGAGGTGTNGDTNHQGGDGTNGAGTLFGGTGGSSLFGGGARGAASFTGVNAGTYGGGGGGSQSATFGGGTGGGGLVIIEYVT